MVFTKLLVKRKRNNSYSQFSDHYFTGDYPVSPLDADGENKIAQLSLLSGKSSINLRCKVGFFYHIYIILPSTKITSEFMSDGRLT